jgi:2,4-dienoyl-CoA reductase-like NADH-dependent reductase (Old Yellow Enzyme family)
MASSDIFGQYGYVVSELDKRGLSFIDIIRPRSTLFGDYEKQDAQMEQAFAALASRGVPESEYRGPAYKGLKPFRALMKNTPLLASGNFTEENINDELEAGISDAVVFGRLFISNPDLVERLRKGVELTKYDRSTFYYVSERASDKGYNDYPFYQPSAAHL